jgi:integrase
LESPLVRTTPTLPFEPEEFERILAACTDSPYASRVGADNRLRLRALLLLLRYSGLRISDAVALSVDRLLGDLL